MIERQIIFMSETDHIFFFFFPGEFFFFLWNWMKEILPGIFFLSTFSHTLKKIPEINLNYEREVVIEREIIFMRETETFFWELFFGIVIFSMCETEQSNSPDLYIFFYFFTHVEKH